MASILNMENISIRRATIEDVHIAVAMDYALNKEEHIEIGREEKITTAIQQNKCFIIVLNTHAVGFVIFDYRFFNQGWIELIIIDEKFRNRGIAGQVFKLLCKLSKTNKVFSSTNKSNAQMQKALLKAGFTFAGEIEGLDDGDPEWFYYKKSETYN